ncbi:hypothetical protein [Actinomadura decatromicini]|uniref:Uncharacterized protein n=1 Tax=Actinomadura decatromicini TaxID=2604572 RepID=A0A5D3FAL3_9ACTN|nr:hypothetical protein [Actinomadura decatromicini]TYK45112.1 hypothetical protein FXF68_30995 [Actinomadura decatromicini]
MSAERPTYNVRLIPWEHGYEVHVDCVGVTQASDRNDIEEMARDFVATEFDVPADSFDLAISDGAA